MSLHDANWIRLQRVIFTRWAVNKLRESDVEPMADVVKGLTGYHLCALVSKLSEIDQPSARMVPPPKKCKMRVHKIASANNALDFVYKKCAVQQKVKCSAENIVDGDERSILGMIWAIFQKFTKFNEDDDATLDAKTALKMWFANQVKGYPNVTIQNFTKSFRNGLALAALIHKFRPGLIDFDSLDPNDTAGNLEAVFTAAEKYFGLEKYLEIGDFAQLDEKSMVIYVSEYYYGIAQQRKLDLAAKRIGGLIEWTKENDRLKAEYNEKSKALLDTIARVEKVLGDRSIDNTLAGAREKLDKFYLYKKNDKSTIIGTFLDLEGLYNTVALRLADKGRPVFVPVAGGTLADLGASLHSLAEAEAERNSALHAELNRQLTLVEIAKQHAATAAKLNAWIDNKRAYLNTKEDITSSGAALFQINTLKAYDAESIEVQGNEVDHLKKLGANLASEKYENQSTINDAEAAIAAAFTELSGISVEKMKVLEDDYAREQFRDAIELKASQHKAAFEQLCQFYDSKEAAMTRDVVIDSIGAARYQIAVLENEKQDVANTQDTQGDLKKLGAEIVAAKYSGLTEYSYPNPSEITDRHDASDERYAALNVLAGERRTTLEGQLAHEIKRDQLSLQFANAAGAFSNWIANTKAEVESTVFGLTLAEVEAFRAKLDASDAAFGSAKDGKQAALQAAFDEGSSVSFDADVYTSQTLESLAAEASQLSDALTTRQANYDAELAELRRKDGICKAFADIAEPFVARLQGNKDTITAAAGSLEEQLAGVDSRISEGDGGALANIQAAYDAITAENIHHNIHTLLNADDVNTQYADYQNFLNRKKQLIEEEIRHKKLRGLTEQQMEEIANNFREFDRDDSGTLTQNEFKACLFSLGFEKGKKDIQKLVDTFGTGEAMNFAGFENFMIQELGDQGTKEEIYKGMRLINRFKDAGVRELSEMIFPPAVLEYILATAPKPEGEGDYDYSAWVDDMFSR